MSDYRVSVAVIYGPNAGQVIAAWDLEIDTPGLIDPPWQEEAERSIVALAERLASDSKTSSPDTSSAAKSSSGPA